MSLEIISARYTDQRGRELTFPVGNTSDRVKLTLQLKCEFSVTVTQTVKIKKQGEKKYVLFGQGENGVALTWESLGITAGDQLFGVLFYEMSNGFDVYAQFSAFGNETLVSYVDGSVLYVNEEPAYNEGGIPPPENATFESGTLRTNKNPDGFDMYFNVTENTSPSIYSLIDGEPTRFQIDNVSAFVAGGGFVLMPQLGARSGSTYTGSIIRKIQDALTNEGVSIWEMEVNYSYPHFLKPELFSQENSVAPYAEIKALAQFNNPNAYQKTIYSRIAEIGWFDENFNGGENKFTPESIEWTDADGNSISAMSLSGLSKFKFAVDYANGWSGNVITNIGWFWRPANEEDYKNDPEDNNPAVANFTHDQNIFFHTKVLDFEADGTTNSFTSIPKNGIKINFFDVKAEVIGGVLFFSGSTNPSPEFTQFFTDRPGDRNYTLFAKCDPAEYNTDWNSSNAVNLIVDESEMIITETPLGAYPVDYFAFYDHNEDEFTQLSGYTEDDITAEVIFKLQKNTPIKYVRGKIVAFKDGESFDLEGQTFDLSVLPILGDGSIPVNFNTDRNFNIAPELMARYIRLLRVPEIDTPDSYGVKFNYGFLSRHEYWLDQLNASNDFYGDKTKDWQHYQENGWALKFVMNIAVDAGEYANGYVFEISNYDEWIGESEITFWTPDGATQLNMPQEGLTLVKARHTLPEDYEWSNVIRWANMTVERFESAGRWLLSSRSLTLNPANPLRPELGETGVKITQVNDQLIITSCIYDSTKLNSNKISFTGRIKSDTIPDTGNKFVFDDDAIIQDDENNELIDD